MEAQADRVAPTVERRLAQEKLLHYHLSALEAFTDAQVADALESRGGRWPAEEEDKEEGSAWEREGDLVGELDGYAPAQPQGGYAGEDDEDMMEEEESATASVSDTEAGVDVDDPEGALARLLQKYTGKAVRSSG